MPTQSKNNLRQSDMDPKELKIALMRKGITQREIAKRLNVKPPVVNQVIRNIAVSHRVRQEIADSLGMDLKRIWPSTYLYGGGPRKPGRPAGVSQ